MEGTLSYREAADILGCSEGTLRQWVWRRRPGLRWLKIGRLVRFRPSDLSAYMEFCQVPADPFEPEEAAALTQAHTS